MKKTARAGTAMISAKIGAHAAPITQTAAMIRIGIQYIDPRATRDRERGNVCRRCRSGSGGDGYGMRCTAATRLKGGEGTLRLDPTHHWSECSEKRGIT